MTRSNPDTPRGPDDFDRLQKILIIRQRLSHSHEDEIIDLLSAQRLDTQNLLNNFPGFQISRPSLQSARAELAPVGTANLGGETKCLAVRRGPIERRAGGNEN